MVKFVALGMFTCFAAYKGNQYLQERLAKRQARIDGRLEDYMEAKEEADKNSLYAKAFGYRPE